MSERKRTQEARILERLISVRGGWVAACDLAAISLQYSARIFALRRAGFAIENKLEIGRDKIKRGFFRLRGGIPAKMQAPAPKLPRPDALFGADELERCAPPSEYPS